MAARPQKYFTATHEPRNLTAGAALPGEDPPSGLDPSYNHIVQNLSPYDRLFFEERETSGAAGEGQALDPVDTMTYEVNADSPLFVWTRREGIIIRLAIGPAI